MAHHTKNHHNKSTSSNLWQGFAAGAVAGAGVLFLLGTKKGRDVLKKAIELSEDIETNLNKYSDDIEDTIREEIVERIAPVLPHTPYDEEKQQGTGLSSVLDKIKTISGAGKKNKRVFVKE